MKKKGGRIVSQSGHSIKFDAVKMLANVENDFQKKQTSTNKLTHENNHTFGNSSLQKVQIIYLVMGIAPQ